MTGDQDRSVEVYLGAEHLCTAYPAQRLTPEQTQRRIRPLITARLVAIAGSVTGRWRPENRSLQRPSVRHHGQAGCSERGTDDYA